MSEGETTAAGATLRGHLQIVRVGHWPKNIFMLPGIVVALGFDLARLDSELPLRLAIGTLAVCLVASSNYVLNEIIDAPHDRNHPFKSDRPIATGRANVALAWFQWVALFVAGLGLGWLFLSPLFAGLLAVFWVFGCAYNLRPIRLKDVPYLDVLTEAFNNPLRMLFGWYLTGTELLPPVSLLISYWMVGSYLMAIKRFAEYRTIGDRDRAVAYRDSFRHYNATNLLISITFYGSTSMLFFGAFLMRYRLELVLAFPLVAMVMARYLALAFEPDSPVQRPEGLYREPSLMIWVALCSMAMVVLLFVDVPQLHRWFSATDPVGVPARSAGPDPAGERTIRSYNRIVQPSGRHATSGGPILSSRPFTRRGR